MIELFTLIALWCAPMQAWNGSEYAAERNYGRVQECRIRLMNCLRKGGEFNYSSKLEGCLYDSGVERGAK